MYQLCVNIVFYWTLILLVSKSFYLLYDTTKFFNLAFAFCITGSGYLTHLFSRQFNLPTVLAILGAIVSIAGIGILSEILFYKPLRKRGASSMALMIASLGLYVILQNAISIVWGNSTKSIRTWDITVGHTFFGAHITSVQIISIIVCILLFILGIVIMKYSSIGRNIRAVASNSELSNIVGISSDRVILWAFGIGSALAAVAGILIAFDTDMRPTMGFSWLLYGVVAMIIGGVGSNWGLVGGALLLAAAQHMAGYYIGSQWMDAVAYIILILFLIAKPLGFSGKRLKKIEI